jgi:hypothetical protein
MNLNDPFGRLESKKQKEYESLRDSLKEKGLNNREDAQALIQTLRKRGIWGVGIIVPSCMLLALIFSDLRAFILLCGGLAAFWLIKTVLNSQEYVKRYVQEELDEQDQ